METKMKLTKAQKDCIRNIKEVHGELRGHITPTGRRCYRLVDSLLNPIKNYSRVVVSNLYNKNYLEKKDGILYVKNISQTGE